MEDKAKKIEQDIRKMMEKAKPWDSRKTNISGIFIVRLPSKEFKIKLVFNPLDEDGNPRKRRGFFFSDLETARGARAAFSDDRLDALVMAIESINGSSEREPPNDDEVLEI